MSIYVHDEYSPEIVAMLQALYSRDPRSVTEHIKQMSADGAAKFMSTYYVGYGHKSIGDCGSTTVFIENVSMLAAKAIQDWPLYSGQEASTRYLDMSKQEFLDPTGRGVEIQERWRHFYSYVLKQMMDCLEARFPIKDGEKPATYAKAIKARAFDIARAFLPAGAATFVSWHSNLRQMADHLKGMRNHPLIEIRGIASDVLTELRGRYKASFLHKEYAEEEEYLEVSEARFAYEQGVLTDFTYQSQLSQVPNDYLLCERPAKTELHHRYRRYGNIKFSFPLDFGSYRDLQRQRSCVQDMPLLTTGHGFHPWYLEQMPDKLVTETKAFLQEQEKAIASLSCDPLIAQYYIGMGYLVPVVIYCSLPSAVYIAELRSSDTVHPTLRMQAQRMGDALEEIVPGLKMHHDRTPGVWNIKRGEQDIVKRG